MELYILDSTYTPIAVIDSYKSLIWTKRYFTYGDFELYLPANRNLLQYLQCDYFITREDDDSVMIIEKLEIKTDVENGDFFIVSGRSLESILLRRVCQRPININVVNPIQGIKKLIDACTSDAFKIVYDRTRAIPELVVDDSLSIEAELKAQFTGDTLLNAISAICIRFGIGIKMTISNSQLLLSFYIGEQADVIFSQEFDNLINSSYLYDKTNFFNNAWVAGEGEGDSRKCSTVFRISKIPTPPPEYDPPNFVLIPMTIDEYNPNTQSLDIYLNNTLQTIGTDYTTEIVIDEDDVRELKVEFPDNVLNSHDAVKAEVYTIEDVQETKTFDETKATTQLPDESYADFDKPDWYDTAIPSTLSAQMFSYDTDITNYCVLSELDAGHLRVSAADRTYSSIRLILSGTVIHHDQRIIHTTKTAYVPGPDYHPGYEPLGIALRELYVDARDISSDSMSMTIHVKSAYDNETGNLRFFARTEEEFETVKANYLRVRSMTEEYFDEHSYVTWEDREEFPATEYFNMLEARGNEKLDEYSITKVFEAEIEPRMTFKYKDDYNLGDIVEVTTEYGITAHPRIVEIIESWDETGYTVIPTLEELEVE